MTAPCATPAGTRFSRSQAQLAFFATSRARNAPERMHAASRTTECALSLLKGCDLWSMAHEDAKRICLRTRVRSGKRCGGISDSGDAWNLLARLGDGIRAVAHAPQLSGDEMSIELTERDGAPVVAASVKLPTKEYVFESRDATFLVRTDNSAYSGSWAVQFRVGPLGMNLSADEAEALGRALTSAAEHYRSALARAQGVQS